MIADYRIKIDWTFVFLIFCPLFYVYGQDMREVQASFFQCSIILLVGLMHCNRYLGLFLIWCGFQAVFMKNADPYVVTNIFFGLMAYQFIVKCSNVSELKKYFRVFLGVLALNVFWCLLQKFNIDPIFSMRDFDKQQLMSEQSGFFGLPAFLGNYASPLISISLASGYWGVLFVLPALFVSKSSFSVISALFGVLFFLWFRKRLFFWVAFAVFGILSIVYVLKFDLPTGDFNRRLNAWKVISRAAFEAPYFGHGIGSFKNDFFIEFTKNHKTVRARNFEQVKMFLATETIKQANPPLAQYIVSTLRPETVGQVKKEMQKRELDFEVWEKAHNEYLHIFYETGLVGILILFFYLKDLFKRFWEYGRKNTGILALAASAVSILLVSAGHFPFQIARLAGPYLCLLAFLDLALIHAKKQTESTWA